MANSYGHLNDSGAAGNGGRKKNILVIALSSILLVAVVVGVVVGVSKHNGAKAGGDDSHLASTNRAIVSICQPTDYKEQCVSSLTAAAGNETDPKKLIDAAFNVAIDNVVEALKNSSVIREAAKDPRTAEAVEDCQELLDSAVIELKKSFDNLGSLDITKVDDILDDLRVWMSAANTYHETCKDGFENITGSEASERMIDAVNRSQQLTTNVLAIVDEMSTVLASFNLPFLQRRLLSTGDDIPDWVNAGKRKLLQLSPTEMKPDVVVAQDGSGQFKTINEALRLIPKSSAKNFVIYIKAGVYKESVTIQRNMTNVVMIGDGQTKTVISGSLNWVDLVPTFKTATVAVVGEGFIAKDLGIENTAGAIKHQAVALRVSGDKSVFYRCQFDAYQDTLYVHTQRQFYRDCTISGTIDFIFGNAKSVFQNCLMLLRKPLANQQNIVTAQGRITAHDSTGIVLQNCTISGEPDYLPVMKQNPSYLGRPWKSYSRTIIMQSQIDEVIHSDGWLPWAGDYGLRTCFYAELDNRGPGALTTGRVTWPGIKKLAFNKAQTFTVENFVQGSTWINATGVPYVPGMLPTSDAGKAN